MFTKVTDLLLDGPTCPAGPDEDQIEGTAVLDRVVPLWIASRGAQGPRPTVRFGGTVLSARSARACTGRWQLHLFSFAAEARQALQTLRIVDPALECEAGTRPTGEGLLLLREGEGPFACRIIDRRGLRRAGPAIGSWDVGSALARRAALHAPAKSPARAEAAARILAREFDDAEEAALLRARLGGCGRGKRHLGCIEPQAVVNAANRLLEPLGAEICCSDRQVLAVIDAHLESLAPEMEALVDRIAHDLVAELAEGGLG